MSLDCAYVFADIDDRRLKMAGDLGADHVIKVTDRDHHRLADQIRRMLGNPPHVSLLNFKQDAKI